MKNYDYWKSFISSGKVDDYLHYIACTREEENMEEYSQTATARDKEGGFIAGVNHSDGNGPVSHADWGL